MWLKIARREMDYTLEKLENTDPTVHYDMLCHFSRNFMIIIPYCSSMYTMYTSWKLPVLCVCVCVCVCVFTNSHQFESTKVFTPLETSTCTCIQ